MVASSSIDVGYFNDDARYINAARSLARGSYVDLELPAHPPDIDRLPGYPIFLTPFIKVVSPHWPWLKLTSILLTSFSCLLLYGLFEETLPVWPRLLLVALFGLNPTVVKYSCALMSEPLFTFVALLSFALFKKWLETGRPLHFAFMTLTLICAVFIRPEGLALLLAIPFALIIHRRRRAALVLFMVPSFAFALFLLRNYLRTQIPSGYLQQLTQIVLYLSGHYAPVLENMGRSLKVLFVDTLLQASLPWASALLGLGWSGFVSLLSLGLILIGFRSNCKYPEASTILMIGAGAYVLCYVMMHGFFLSVNSRYYFGILPFVLAWSIMGAKALAGRSGHPRFWMFLGASVLLFLYGNPWTSPADKIFLWRAHSYRNPWQTLAWIKTSTPPDAFVLAIKASTVHLYTNRFSVSEVQAVDVEGFRYALLKNGFTHILIAPSRLMTLGGKNFQNMLMLWNHTDQWIPAWPGAFDKVFENGSEGTTVYRVNPDERYRDAYELCQSADSDFGRGDWVVGIDKLKRALALYPRFPGALNRYGMALMAWHGDRSAAEKKFLQAVKIQPDFAFALLNLAKIYHKIGEEALAQKYLAEMQKSISNVHSWSGDPQQLNSIIRLEWTSGAG